MARFSISDMGHCAGIQDVDVSIIGVIYNLTAAVGKLPLKGISLCLIQFAAEGVDGNPSSQFLLSINILGHKSLGHEVFFPGGIQHPGYFFGILV